MENVPEGQEAHRPRGQRIGLVALILMLLAIVTLAAIGHPWVAGVVATGLAAVVAIFVPGQHRAESTSLSANDELTGAPTELPDAESR